MSQERQPYSNIRRVGNRFNQIDTHELLKREIYSQKSDINADFQFGFNAPAITAPPSSITPATPSPVPPAPPVAASVGFEDIEIYFDSTQRDTSSDYSVGEIKWSIPDLNNSSDIKNCIEMYIGEFYFPKIYSPTGTPEYLYFQRILVEFQNAPSTQAVLGPNNNKFHFEFRVENLTGQSVKLVPLKNTFFFQRPITSITDFQIRFMVPPMSSLPLTFKKIPIPHDTVPIVSLLTGGVGYNPIRFQITGSDDTTTLGLVGSTGTPGVAVFISSYGSNDATTNTAVNNTNGLYVTNIIDSTTFEIAGINAAAVTAQYSATMFIPKNRIAFPIRFTSVRNQLTNYIDVNHS